MNKFTKIAVSFLLIISIILNPFGAVFDIKAGAIAPILVEFGKWAIVELLKGAGVTAVYYLTKEGIEAGAEAIEEANRIQEYSLNAMKQAVGVEISPYPEASPEDGKVLIGSLHAKLIEGVELTDEESDFANYMVNYINNHPDEFELNFVDPVDGYDVCMTASQYETIKNTVTNSYIEYTMKQIAQKELDDSILSMKEAGIFPTYDFNFVGPMASISYPVTSGLGSLQKEGFVYSPAIPQGTCDSNGWFSSEASARSYCSGFDVSYVIYSESMGYQPNITFNSYCYGCYILYEGEIYYCPMQNYTGNLEYVSRSIFEPSKYYHFPYAYSASGTQLSSVYKEGDGFSFGIYSNKTNEVQAAMPQSVSFTEDDFNQTTGGGTVDIPRTEAEEIIGNAIGVGLITPDSVLEIGTDGVITAVDGIELAKLQEICDAIAEGNLQFENVQEYLNIITKLISSGNYTATEQTALLENIKELENAQAKSIEEINTAVTSIAAALTAKGEIDLETPDFSFIDRFPFCLPFDLYYVFSLLCSEPKEPVFKVPLKATIGTGDFNYELDEEIVLDLTIFKLNGYDMVQIFTQTSSTLLFVICLIGATKKLMWK